MTARELAARCLVDTAAGGYSNLVFKQKTAGCALDSRELAFSAALFYGALERQVTLDYILTRYSKTPLTRLDPEVLAVLRSGLYQCLFMDSVPAAAAVDESVKLARRLKKSSAAGLINAVLRAAAKTDLTAAAREIGDPIERLAFQYSLCRDIVSLVLEQYPENAESIFRGSLAPRRRVIRVNTLKTEPAALARDLAAQSVESKPAALPAALEITAGRYLETDAFKTGLFRPQSLAAQAAVWALGPKPGERVLDLCAAPGGKTLTAAQMMGNRGRIFAYDRSETRLGLLRQQAALEGVDIVESAALDTAATPPQKTGADRVLCDVPCSGLGEMAAKPELRSKPLGSIGELPPLQLAILKNGACCVKPGGRLVYSSCTFNKRENDDVVIGFLAEFPDFRPVEPNFLEAGTITFGQTLNFLPNDCDPEGFFIATFERMC